MSSEVLMYQAACSQRSTPTKWEVMVAIPQVLYIFRTIYTAYNDVVNSLNYRRCDYVIQNYVKDWRSDL